MQVRQVRNHLHELLRCKELTQHTEILSENGKSEEAAWLYIRAKEYKKAACIYQELGDHEKVLAAYFHGRQYNELAKYLNECTSCPSLSKYIFR